MNSNISRIGSGAVMCDVYGQAFGHDLEVLEISYSFAHVPGDDGSVGHGSEAAFKLHCLNILFPFLSWNEESFVVSNTMMRNVSFAFDESPPDQMEDSYTLYSLDESINIYWRLSRRWCILPMAGIHFTSEGNCNDMKKNRDYHYSLFGLCLFKKWFNDGAGHSLQYRFPAGFHNPITLCEL